MENGDGGGGGGGILRELQDLGEKFKVDDQDEQYISPYAHLEKATVLQEARYVVCVFYCTYLLLIVLYYRCILCECLS
jgi:hypothetical protein